MITDVWTLETPREKTAILELSFIIGQAYKFGGVGERAYLRKLWAGESWQSIKAKLQTEGSVWYVWWMDGVRAHITGGLNLSQQGKANGWEEYINMPKTLEEAIQIAKRTAYGDLLRASSPFAAIHWMQTLPAEWQADVEDAIVEVYNNN